MNALSWAGLLALGIAASCAQGSSDTGDDAGIQVGGDAGREGVDAGGEAGGGATGDDSGGGTTSQNDGGSGSGDQDSGVAVDTGVTTEDAGVDSSAPVMDSGVDTGTVTTMDAGSVVPTTCAQADQGVGCCAANNNYYCTSTNMVGEKKCTGGEVCGWNASKMYYDCVAAPGGSDPSGTYPIACK